MLSRRTGPLVNSIQCGTSAVGQERQFKYRVAKGKFKPYVYLRSEKSSLAQLTFRQLSEDLGCFVDQEPEELRSMQFSVQAGGLPIEVE